MNKKTIIILCSILIAAGGGSAIYSTYAQNEDNKQAAYQYPPVKVALAPVSLNTAPRTFYGVGELEAGSQVLVAAETSGRITKIAFGSGQQVKKSQYRQLRWIPQKKAQ